MKNVLLLFLLACSQQVVAQITGTTQPADTAQIAATESSIDTAYITDLYDRFTLRLYGSNKFTRYSIGRGNVADDLLYKSNSNYNIGVGFNYRWLAINLGFRTPFVNDDEEQRGKTKYLDLQAYVYGRKFNIDIYAQTYKGYYQAETQPFSYNAAQPLYLRPDLHTRNAGISIERILNPKRYSFRAAYLQNEYQKKSAGTFLVGAGAHYLHVTADSAIVPSSLNSEILSGNSGFAHAFNKSQVASLAVHGGYAYTLVISRHVFLMGQLMAGAGISYTTLSEVDVNTLSQASNVSYHLNGIVRAGLGYQGEQYFTGIYFVTNLWHSPTPLEGVWQRYETGVLRVAVARHFTLRDKTVKSLERFEPRMLRR